MMARLVYQKSIIVTGVSHCSHISHVTSDRVCISDWNNLILTNTAGEDLHRVTDIVSGYGVHTVNGDGDLIYIDREYNINKLSTVNKVKSTLIKYTAPWRPQCVYSSPSTGDLLVGMENTDTETLTAKVTRYNSTGENIQTIQHNNTGQRLYSEPWYITENHNGDVIVSDYLRGVVVTECGGRHRFSYTGPPSGSRLEPYGICTDALSHILVCDLNTNTVHMIDKDGHFVSQIKTKQQGIDEPGSLSYDVNTHLLWVGSWWDNTVNIYRCVYGDSLTGLPKCKYHPRGTLEDFCVQCQVPLCKECTSSIDHRGHDCRDVRKSLEEVHKKTDGDAVLMCLLLCKSYRINLKEDNWIKKYNAVAEIFNFQKIIKGSSPANLEKYSPILKHNISEVMFSHEFLRHASFLKFAEDPKFVDIFLTWSERENIAEYCRSWVYPRKEEEVFCWLLPEQTEQLVEKLGEDIFTHPTMQDPSIHDIVFSKVGIPMQIIMRGDESVKNFIENLQKGRTVMYHASGMIVGCAGSGKTTLLERLKNIDLKEILENTTSTRGIDVQSDVFDVTDTIKVNSSIQKHHFKITFDEASQLRNVPEHPVEVTNDLKVQDLEEPVGAKNIASDAVNVEQMSEDNMNFEPKPKRIKMATLSEKPVVEVEDSQNVAKNSELSGVLHVTKNVDDPEKKITMVDFAGQCAYYASHQIFLSPRAFFILVLNMEKKFDDKVGEEVCSQEGSIYKGWTHRDYLTFWVKSIHQYSGDKAPILLVGTHAEEKTEQEKVKFFGDVCMILDAKDLQSHLHKKRMFAVGFHDNKSIDEIKLSVANVVQELDHWGEQLPRSWAIFETFFQEKKYLKIMNTEALQLFNAELPQEIKLEKIEDMHVMLQFFHDIREILHFNQIFLKEIIILDVQWFADAFKNVITDKNHAEIDLVLFAKEWREFNETGELPDKLLSAIWEMNDNGYIEHKNEIMPYMEKLGLLADMGEENKKWYVPCMNSRPFPVDSFSSYPASSILCYKFDVLPAGIFHRLVATCMQIPWEIFSDEDRGCIYQTAAVFVFQDHNILIGMTQTEIQLQVFVIEEDVDVSTCLQIRERIESILHNLSSTFQTNSKFQVAFKCKPSGFCDSKESAVINESKFATRAKFLCPSCPAKKKHNIYTEDITKYWKQRKTSASSTPMATGQDMGGRSRFAKLGMATNDVLNQAYRDILELEVAPSIVYNKVKASPIYKRLRPEQEHLLQDAKFSGYMNFDISLTYTLIRNICSKIPKPTKRKWGEEPAAGEVTVGDDIERIRSIRNSLTAHVSSASTLQKEFDDTWSSISDICQRLEIFTGKKYLDKLKHIQKLTLKEEDEDAIIEKVKMESQHEMVKTIMSEVQGIKSEVQEMKTILKPEGKDATNYEYYS